MTFEKLLELSATELEAISDSELEKILIPVLNNFPPVELKKVQEYEEREKARKDEIKNKKKFEKQIEKEAKKLEEPTVTITTKPTKNKKLSVEELKQMSQMIEQMKKNMQLKTN